MFRRLIVLVLLASMLVGVRSTPSTADEGESLLWSESVPDFDSPALFVPNQGQWESSVRFKVEAPQATVWLMDNAIWLTIFETPPRSKDHFLPMEEDLYSQSGSAPVELPSVRAHNLKITLEGMNSQARFVPLEPQTTTMSWFIGGDPSAWQTSVPTFAAVQWEGVYPGVNLVLRNLEGSLVLEPKLSRESDLSQIRLQVEGADSLRETSIGGLVAETPVGSVLLPALVEVGGLPLPMRLRGAEVIVGAHSATTENDDGNSVATLLGVDFHSVIHSAYLGGNSADLSYSILGDIPSGLCVAGETWSAELPSVPGSTTTGNSDILVATTNITPYPAMVARIGGKGFDSAYGLADCFLQQNFITLAGYTTSPDFPSPGVPGGVSAKGGDAVFVRLAYGQLQTSLLIGGTSTDIASAVKPIGYAHEGEYIIAGTTWSSDFPGTRLGPGGGVADGFVALVYCYPTGGGGVSCGPEGSLVVGGTGDDRFAGLAVSDVINRGFGFGNDVAITGFTSSKDFPLKDAIDPSFNGGVRDAFGLQLFRELYTSNLSLIRSSYLGGSGDDTGWDVAYAPTSASSSGATPAVVGSTTSVADFGADYGLGSNVNHGGRDAFFIRLERSTPLSPNPPQLFGGLGNDVALGVAWELQGQNSWTIVGGTSSSDFDPKTSDVLNGSADAFVVGVTVDKKVSSTALVGGSAFEQAEDIFWPNASGTVGTHPWITGRTSSIDFPAASNSHLGSFDAFVAQVVTPPAEHCARKVFWAKDGGTSPTDGTYIDASWDTANCQVKPVPPGGAPFIYNNSYYIADNSGVCSAGYFDSENCYLGTPPSLTTAFIWLVNGQPYFYYGE